MILSKRAFLVKPGQFELHHVEVPDPVGTQVLVRIASCGLCNFELNHWKGILGNFPQSVGHEWSGEIVATGSEVTNFSVGDLIATLPKRGGELAGFSEFALADQSQCYLLPKGIKPEQAICEPLKCIVTVVRAAAPEAGDFGVVQGCGPMGLWCISLLAGSLTAGIIALDVDDDKLALAKRLGATHVINTKSVDAASVITKITCGHMADFVIEGTGIPRLLESGIDLLRIGRGRLVLMSSHEEPSTQFDFRKAISKGIQILVPHAAYSLDQKEDMRRTLALLHKGAFHLGETITHIYKLDDIQQAFEALETKPVGFIKGIVLP